VVSNPFRHLNINFYKTKNQSCDEMQALRLVNTIQQSLSRFVFFLKKKEKINCKCLRGGVLTQLGGNISHLTLKLINYYYIIH
jgi:hypothetical protein